MNTTKSFLHRVRGFLNWKSDEMVQMGIFQHRGMIALCAPELEVKGITVRLVTVSRDFAAREKAALNEYTIIQAVLAHKWKESSLRPRRRTEKKVEIPDLNENTESV